MHTAHGKTYFSRPLTLALIVAALFGASAMPALAERLESGSYVIQFGNLNISSGEQSGASYNVTQSVGQIAAGPYGQYGSSNYFVGGGFQYIYQIPKFRFIISDINLDLGTLTTGVHNTATNTLEIRTNGGSGYAIYAYELHPLRHSNGTANIPDTTCDAGTCSQATAAVWTNQNIPGFGFNIAGDDIPVDFINTTYFRQFANDEGAEAMQPVMSSTDVARLDIGTVTYKAGPPGGIDAGNYQTGIVYVAVPGY